MKLTETCSCGASITVADNDQKRVDDTVATWRLHHCSCRAPRTITYPATPAPWVTPVYPSIYRWTSTTKANVVTVR